MHAHALGVSVVYLCAMAEMKRLTGVETKVRQMVSVESRMHQEVSEELQLQDPGVRGLNSRSVYIFASVTTFIVRPGWKRSSQFVLWLAE